MKPLRFLGDSLKCLREFSEDARQDMGFQTSARHRQRVEELRVWDDSGTYRVVYTARLADAIYVLHAFQKKTQATSQRDIDVARARLNELLRGVK